MKLNSKVLLIVATSFICTNAFGSMIRQGKGFDEAMSPTRTRHFAENDQMPGETPKGKMCDKGANKQHVKIEKLQNKIKKLEERYAKLDGQQKEKVNKKIMVLRKKIEDIKAGKEVKCHKERKHNKAMTKGHKKEEAVAQVAAPTYHN